MSAHLSFIISNRIADHARRLKASQDIDHQNYHGGAISALIGLAQGLEGLYGAEFVKQCCRGESDAGIEVKVRA